MIEILLYFDTLLTVHNIYASKVVSSFKIFQLTSYCGMWHHALWERGTITEKLPISVFSI